METIQRIIFISIFILFSGCSRPAEIEMPVVQEEPSMQIEVGDKPEPELETEPESSSHTYENQEEHYQAQEKLTIHGHTFELPENWEVGPMMDENTYKMRTIEVEPKYFQLALQYLPQVINSSSQLSFRNNDNTRTIVEESCPYELIYCFTIRAFHEGRLGLYFFNIQESKDNLSLELPQDREAKKSSREKIKEILLTTHLEDTGEVSKDIGHELSYIPKDWRILEENFYFAPKDYASSDGWKERPYSLQVQVSGKFKTIEEYMQEGCATEKTDLILNGNPALEFTAQCMPNKPHAILIEIDGSLVEAYSYTDSSELAEIYKMLDSLELVKL